MKIAEKRKIQLECLELVRKYKGTPMNEDNRFIIKTSIGDMFVHVDAICKSDIMSLFVRFDNAKIAKGLFRHWKVNLHEVANNNFVMSVDMHLDSIMGKWYNESERA